MCRSFWICPSHTHQAAKIQLLPDFHFTFFCYVCFNLPGEKDLFFLKLISWMTSFPLKAHFYFLNWGMRELCQFKILFSLCIIWKMHTGKIYRAWSLCALDIFIPPTPFLAAGGKKKCGAGGPASSPHVHVFLPRWSGGGGRPGRATSAFVAQVHSPPFQRRWRFLAAGAVD